MLWVLILRLNSLCRRSMALVVRALFHWLGQPREGEQVAASFLQAVGDGAVPKPPICARRPSGAPRSPRPSPRKSCRLSICDRLLRTAQPAQPGTLREKGPLPHRLVAFGCLLPTNQPMSTHPLARRS